jgi:hypothetical protein
MARQRDKSCEFNSLYRGWRITVKLRETFPTIWKAWVEAETQPESPGGTQNAFFFGTEISGTLLGAWRIAKQSAHETIDYHMDIPATPADLPPEPEPDYSIVPF